MGAPYEKTFEFTGVESGEDNWLEMRWPGRGILVKVVCVQLSGVEAGFELDLLNSREPMGDAEAGSSSAGEQDHSIDAYKVIPTQVVAANGKVALFDVEYPYVNQDGTPTDIKRRIYARIKPAGTGGKEFQLTLAMNTPDA